MTSIHQYTTSSVTLVVNFELRLNHSTGLSGMYTRLFWLHDKVMGGGTSNGTILSVQIGWSGCTKTPLEKGVVAASTPHPIKAPGLNTQTLGLNTATPRP